MTMFMYLVAAVIMATLVFTAKEENYVEKLSLGFYGLQLLFAFWVLGNVGVTEMEVFTYDQVGGAFLLIMALIAPAVFHYSRWYLDVETLSEKRIYYALLILLNASIASVYLTNNVAVTWIFLEATTLCTAGLVYHRKSDKSLEATWKYIFVCSVGIAMAYLGVLLLGSIAQDGDMSYQSLAANAANGNPLYMKLAFLFVLVGYSCKMEIFPLYSIGIDANYSAPAPVSALLSSALVNAGFVSIYRVYQIMKDSEFMGWVSGVLIVAGIISVLIGALYLRRTNHYKRFLAYSTVENMGIVAIGLGVGGVGVFAALFHVAAHSIIKSAMFLQMAKVGKTYGNYQVSRIGQYMSYNQHSAALLMLTTVLLLGFPPSPLFISEIMIFKQMVSNGQWLMLAVVILLICIVIYNFGFNIIRLCYHRSRGTYEKPKINYSLFIPVFALLALAILFGMWQPDWLVDWFQGMI